MISFLRTVYFNGPHRAQINGPNRAQQMNGPNRAHKLMGRMGTMGPGPEANACAEMGPGPEEWTQWAQMVKQY